LVDRGLEPMVADPHRLMESLRRAAEEVRAGRSPLADAGMLGLVATPEQLEALQRIQALMSLLEGHGDVTMDRAGAAAVPGAERFSRVLRERRQQVKGPARLLQQVLGLEAKLRQYAEGEEFIKAVERAGGPDLFNRVWRGPEWLPSLSEIRSPGEWVARVGAPPAAPA
jgi:putative hydrolase